MTAPSTDTHSSMVACPPLEDIAAFLDGTLSPEERARITEHLARCESCYEIFAGAVHFQEEEEDSSAEDIGRRDVIPFPLAEEKAQEKHVRVEPARPPRRVSRWLPLAASVVLAAGLGFFAWRFFAAPSTMDVVDLAAQIQEKPGVTGSLYRGETYRGPGAADDFLSNEHAFLAGAYLMDLHLSVQAGDAEQASAALHSLGSEVQEIGFSGDLGERYQKESARLESAEGLREFAERLSEEERTVQELLSLYEPFYSFGLWAEAGRLAAVTHTQEFFETRKNRRLLAHLQKTLPGQFADEELQKPVLEDLQAIERIWDQGQRSQEDYRTLATHFQNIIRRIDDYEEVPISAE